jgi:hypothetical protein
VAVESGWTTRRRQKVLVTNGAEWTTEHGNKRMHTESLDDEDGRRLKGEAWDAMSWEQQHEFLDKTADLLVLKYLYQNEAISKDVFDTRVSQVKAR